MGQEIVGVLNVNLPILCSTEMLGVWSNFPEMSHVDDMDHDSGHQAGMGTSFSETVSQSVTHYLPLSNIFERSLNLISIT